LAVGLLREDDGNLFLPVGMGRVRCLQAIENEVWCHARWKQNEGKTRTADLLLFNGDGKIAVEIQDLRVQQVSIAALRQMSGSGSERLIYDLNWERFRLPAGDTKNQTWLIVADKDDALARKLADRLDAKNHSVVAVQLESDEPFKQVSETRFRFCGEEIENWNQLFETLSTTESQFQPQGISWVAGGFESQDATQNTNTTRKRVNQAPGLNISKLDSDAQESHSLALRACIEIQLSQFNKHCLGRIARTHD